jgi:cytidylate kinase
MVVITVSGPPGSGKSTVAIRLANELGLRHVSAGQIFRKLAADKGLDLLQLSLIAEKDHTIDKEVDSITLEEAKKGNVVLEGHITGWVVPQADLKIYLNAPLTIRAQRIAMRESISFLKALEQTRIREMSEKMRYREIYGYNLDCLNNFDLVLDTSKWELKPMLDLIVMAVKGSLLFLRGENTLRK